MCLSALQVFEIILLLLSKFVGMAKDRELW